MIIIFYPRDTFGIIDSLEMQGGTKHVSLGQQLWAQLTCLVELAPVCLLARTFYDHIGHLTAHLGYSLSYITHSTLYIANSGSFHANLEKNSTIEP